MASVWIATILKVEELPVNATFNYAGNCGMENCPETKLPEATSDPTLQSAYNLFTTLIISTLCSILIAIFFVDDLNYDSGLNEIERQPITTDHISNFLKNFYNSKCNEVRTKKIELSELYYI